MKNKKSKKILVFLFYFLLPLLFLKIDYRFIETFNCCQDDHDYYSHAETIAIDFDLNYDNQFLGFETERYNNNGKIAPKGFIGTGIFSSPFLLIGNLFESLFNFSNNLFNLRIAIYSLSSIFYFYLSIYLMSKVFDILNIKLNPNLIFIIFFGSGISYFAFERYSMSHVYEAFSITLIIYLSVNFYKKTGKYECDSEGSCYGNNCGGNSEQCSSPPCTNNKNVAYGNECPYDYPYPMDSYIKQPNGSIKWGGPGSFCCAVDPGENNICPAGKKATCAIPKCYKNTSSFRYLKNEDSIICSQKISNLMQVAKNASNKVVTLENSSGIPIVLK